MQSTQNYISLREGSTVWGDINAFMPERFKGPFVGTQPFSFREQRDFIGGPSECVEHCVIVSSHSSCPLFPGMYYSLGTKIFSSWRLCKLSLIHFIPGKSKKERCLTCSSFLLFPVVTSFSVTGFSILCFFCRILRVRENPAEQPDIHHP